jgi:hypothetical protein
MLERVVYVHGHGRAKNSSNNISLRSCSFSCATLRFKMALNMYERTLASLHSSSIQWKWGKRCLYKCMALLCVFVCLRILDSVTLDASKCVCMFGWVGESMGLYECARTCMDRTGSCMITYVRLLLDNNINYIAAYMALSFWIQIMFNR